MGSWRWIFSIISRRGPVPNWTVLPQITVFKEYARQFIIHPNVNIDYKNIYISCELLMLPSSAMILKPIKLSELVQRSHIVGLACELYSNIRKTSPVWGWGLAVWFNSVCPQWPHGFCCIWHNQIQNHIIQLKRCRYTATRVSSYPQVLFPCHPCWNHGQELIWISVPEIFLFLGIRLYAISLWGVGVDFLHPLLKRACPQLNFSSSNQCVLGGWGSVCALPCQVRSVAWT